MQQQQPEPEPPLGVTALLKQQSEQALREANVEPGSTMMDPKKPPGTAGQPIGTVTTNVFRLDPRDKNARVFHYEVRVDGIRQNESEVDVTFRSNSDHRTSDRRFICHSVMAMFKLREPGIAGDGASLLYYDLSKTLYSLRQLQLPQQGRSFEYTEQQIIAEVNDAIPREFRAYRLTITPAEQKLVLLSDISYLSADAAAIDRTREQFLDIATSQEVFDRQTGVENSYVNYSVSSYYLLNPSHFGFTAEDCPVFPSNASFLGIGVNKGVRPIRAPNGEVTSGLVVAVKKSAFHINQDETIYQKADALFSSFSDGPELRRSGATALSRRLQPAIKHIFVETIYNQPHTQIFVVDGLAEFDADHYNFVAIIHGRETRVTVTQYYRERYGIRLAHPEMPLIIRTRPNQDNGYYPMELCRILDNQRVKGDQQTPQQLAEMIRKTAVPPAVHFDQNMRLKNSLHLQGSAYLRSAGLHVDSEPIQANARLLPPPQVKFLRNPPETPKASDASWNGGEYLVPARCTKWVAIGFEGSEKPPFTADEWTKFVGLFVNKIAQKGMHYAQPDVRFERIPDVPQLKWYLEGLSGEGFEYALIAHSGDSDFHDELKYGERKTEMVIQGVRVQTVKKVLKDGKFLIVENLAHKANVKMGGLNYVIVPPREPQLQALFSDETMFLGFATNHPSGGFGPSRVDNLDLFSSGSSGTGRGRNGNVLRTGRGPNGNRAAASKGPNGNLLRRRSSSRGKTPATRPPSKPQQPNQPTPNPPSVLGFAANIGPKNHSELVGDFRFQPALRQEVAAIIADIVETCVKQFRVHRRKFPRRIVIYRNDCAEGMYQQVLRYEVPLMRAALSKLGCQATFTVIVASKLQSVRVFASQINRQARSADQNVSPGTVVDTGIVHPIWNEFFLTSHSSPQGTSRTPRYAILLDENMLNMDTLELMTHHLCFGHQIIFSPTSLPSPVYIALEYAKRGRNQYNAWYNAWAQENPNQPPTTIRTHEELSQQLSYQNTQYLKNLRVNA